MITYKDCPECGARKIHSTVRLCEVCETCEKYESKLNAQWADLERIASLCGRTADEHPLQAVARVVRERDQARAEVEQLRRERDEQIAEAASWRATARDKGYSAREVAKERDEARAEVERLRAERRQLRARLVECRPWVGVCPIAPAMINEMSLVRDLADDTLAEVPK